MRENALLRKQLEVACRQIAHPRPTWVDRGMLVILARLAPTLHSATSLVQPATILRWQRQGFQLFWRRTFKRTIQQYMRRGAGPRPPGQRWATFLRNHAHEPWACDFLQTYDLLFRPIFAFCLIALGSRRVVHVGGTRSPATAWVAQQLREATPWGDGPRVLIRDHDDMFGRDLDTVAAGTGIAILRTPVRAPNANAVCERFLRCVRTECRDHVLILDAAHLVSILRRYGAYFRDARPHQGIAQKIPNAPPEPPAVGGKIEETPILGGLHHDYRRAA